ncbi:MAG: gliding motility-associated C-terminal domain-containing protein [Flavobacteriales bacterium]|nr:gliding motility-associated C-terminal domain-containing protein [Flavobacteriales bacterium]
MSDLERDSFEEFLKDSLENYSSNDAPDWSEMESRLDASEAVSPNNAGGSGLFSNSLARWIAGVAMVTGVALLVANLMSSEEPKSLAEDNTSTSLIDKIKALSIEGGTKKTELPEKIVATRDHTDKVSNASQDGRAEAHAIDADNNRNDKSTEADIVFSKAVPPIAFEPSGATIDMLRAHYGDKPTPAPVAGFGDDLKEGSGCVPLNVTFKLESQDVAMKYYWDFGDGTYSTDANPSHVYQETGSFEVELTVTSLINGKAVTMDRTNPLIVYGIPEVAFNWADEEYEAGNEVTFVDLSSNVVDWYWSFGDREFSAMENPSHTYLEEGTYIVELIGKDANGCSDTLASTIRISGKQLTHNFFAPSAFTPNSDGTNDEFKILVNGPQTLEFEMSIYDRQGNLIFETDDVNRGWDGRLNRSGDTAPQGTYIWLVIIRDDKGNHDRQVGEITLIK